MQLTNRRQSLAGFVINAARFVSIVITIYLKTHWLSQCMIFFLIANGARYTAANVLIVPSNMRN